MALKLFKISLSVFCFALIGALQLSSSGILSPEIINKIVLGLSILGIISEAFDWLMSKIGVKK